MKYIFLGSCKAMVLSCYLIGWMLACTSCSKAPETTVSVRVEGTEATGKISIGTEDSIYTVSVDTMGMSVFRLSDNLKPGYGIVQYDVVGIPVYIEPGKSFDVLLKFDERYITPQFSGEGAKKNDYLNNASFKKFRPDYKSDEATFMAALAEQEMKFNATLDSLGFDAYFNKLEKKRIHYLVYSKLLSYPSYYADCTQDKEYKPSGRYYEQLAAAIEEEEELMGMSEYEKAFSGYISVQAEREMQEYDPWVYVKNKLEYIDNHVKSPVIAEHFVDLFTTEYVNDAGIDHLDEIAPIYDAKVSSSEKKAAFEELCRKWAGIAKGQPAPAFQYLDNQGKEVSLADLAGKYVYIDVWATWCGPCRKELPHLKELEQQFKGKNIHFVSISCDWNKTNWEKMVQKEKLGGIQLHNGGDQSFMEVFMIRGIPRFNLLDREGKILVSHMTRPSNPKTAETLNALEGI